MARTSFSNFYPRPPRGGRLCLLQRRERLLDISIHALREEGDFDAVNVGDALDISIHALREEGDLSVLQALEWREIFLSTPSARRATLDVGERAVEEAISIHALREEGDENLRRLDTIGCIFLSTPSARRATASRKVVPCVQIKFLSTPSARRATCS